MENVFIISNVLFALFIGGLAYIFARRLTVDYELWRTLPRAKIPGIVMGFPCLLIAAWHGIGLLGGGMPRFELLIWFLVPVISVLCWFHLDFLCTRAIGGVMLLTVPFLSQLGFALDVSGRPLYAASCYFFGIAGMLLVAIPWRFRDLLYNATKTVFLRGGIAAFLTLSALYFFLAGIFLA